MNKVNLSKLRQTLLENEEKQRSLDHVSSGKLSASDLGSPVQWQVLRYLGVPRRENDPFELGKFKRGRDMEDGVINDLKQQPIPFEQQVRCDYRGCVGYLDIFLDKDEVIEVKSCVAMAFKHIQKEERAKHGHILQACFYALALGRDEFSVVYTCADDLRLMRFDYRTKNYMDKVNNAIDCFQTAIRLKEIPKFVALESWQALPAYNRYLEWKDKDVSELVEQAQILYAKKGSTV